jgi:hypothetical protein
MLAKVPRTAAAGCATRAEPYQKHMYCMADDWTGPYSLLCRAKQASLGLAAPCVRAVCWSLPRIGWPYQLVSSASSSTPPSLISSRFESKPLRKGAPPPELCLAGWPLQRVAGSVNLPEQATSLQTPLIPANQSSPGVFLDLAVTSVMLSGTQHPAFSYLAQGRM